MSDLLKLIERLENASEGSRELDAEIANSYGGLSGMGYEIWEAVEAHAPHYTTSLDAALTLVPEGCYVRIETGPAHDFHSAEIEADDDDYDALNAPSPALALCIASLKARAAEKG